MGGFDSTISILQNTITVGYTCIHKSLYRVALPPTYLRSVGSRRQTPWYFVRTKGWGHVS